MPRSRFVSFMLVTIFQAICFVISLNTNSLFFTGFWGLFLIRKLITAYRLDKFARDNGLV